MTDKRDEALRLAREAFEYIEHNYMSLPAPATKAIAAIREALADSALDRMAENARELGLDYEPIVEQVEDSVGMGHKAWDMVDPKKLAKEFHKALAEPLCKTGSQCTNKCQQCEQPAIKQDLTPEQPAQPSKSRSDVKPLTDEQTKLLWHKARLCMGPRWMVFKRLVEAAHGIHAASQLKGDA